MGTRTDNETRAVLVEGIRIIARKYDLPYAAVEELVELIADLYGVCPECGRTYAKTHGQQKYCPDCQLARERAANREAQARRRARLNAGRDDVIDALQLPPELLEGDKDTTPATPRRVK
jgi:tRNA(Ile2) C34 agmatinyltransferase TiaS